jgi:apolipoprotein N-acyltransferase
VSSTLLKLLLPSILSGLLQFAAFPEINQGWVAWFALAPLFWMMLEARTPAHALGGGLLAGVVRNFGLLIWIPPVLARYGGIPQTVAWLLFILLLLMQAVFPAAACGLGRALAGTRRAGPLFPFPFLWVALEFLSHYVFFGGFPWLLLGYSQTEYARLIQIADITGVYGVSFIIAWMNAALVWLMWRREGQPVKVRTWPLVAAVAMLIAAGWYGESSLRRWGSIVPDRKAALLQGNLELDEPSSSLIWKFREGYEQMASRLAGAGIDLLVLPESPSPLAFQHDVNYRKAMQKLAGGFPLGMVFNNIAYEGENGGTRYYNSAYFLGPDGTELARYDKIHLVPFGEYVPLRRLFFFAESLTKDVSDFQAGREYVLADLAGHPASAIICFESVFPALVRRFVSDGSQLIVNLTNDGWYGDTAAPYQHLSMSRWRAVENRRYLLRATNSGISALIDPTGRIQVSTPLLKQYTCVGGFAFIDYRTVYVRCGDAFAAACVIICFLLFLRSFRLGRRQH